MDNITNGQPAIEIDLDPSIYSNLQFVSFQNNNLCGPYPPSWKGISEKNFSLKGHSKTFWCDPSINAKICSKN